MGRKKQYEQKTTQVGQGHLMPKRVQMMISVLPESAVS
jgi:hypothetical protein